MYDFLYDAIPVNAAAASVTTKTCITTALSEHPQDPSALIAATDQCVAPQERREAAWDLLGVLLLLSVAGGIYWAWPLAKIWHRDLKPFTAENEVKAKILAFLSALCQEVGLARVPIFLTDARSSSMVTFGRRGRYYITIPSTAVMQFQRDFPAFRAIMLHEFGHIRNADIDKTYFALAIGRAFALVALLPWAVGQLFTSRGFDQLVFKEAGLVLGLTVLIYATLQAFSVLVRFTRMCELRCGMDRRERWHVASLHCAIPGDRF